MSDTSNRPQHELGLISAAIMRLAAATRDTSIDALALTVYVSNLDDFALEDIVTTCRRLETTETWFPKLKELVTAIRKTVAANRQQSMRQLAASVSASDYEDEASEATKAYWLGRIRQTVKGGGDVTH